MGDTDAHELALRALRGRDHSVCQLDRRLAGRGVDAAERGQVLASLERAGLLDDRRFAEGRAASLAARGAGDALIRHDLGAAGVSVELVEDVLHSLEAELERARALVERRGRGRKTARYLAGKGFSSEVVGAVAGGEDEELG